MEKVTKYNRIASILVVFAAMWVLYTKGTPLWLCVTFGFIYIIASLWSPLIRLYQRRRVLLCLLNANAFILIGEPDKNSTILEIHDNIAKSKDVVRILASATTQLNNAEVSTDSLIDELGIKRIE